MNLKSLERETLKNNCDIIFHYYWLLFSVINHVHLICFDLIICIMFMEFAMNKLEILLEITPQLNVVDNKIITESRINTRENVLKHIPALGKQINSGKCLFEKINQDNDYKKHHRR